MSRKTFFGCKGAERCLRGGEAPLGGARRNVHDPFSPKLAGSVPAGSPCPAFSCPHPCSPVLPPPPPWTGWLAKGLDVHTPAPSTLKRWGSPLALPRLCAFGLGCISSFPSIVFPLGCQTVHASPHVAKVRNGSRESTPRTLLTLHPSQHMC